MYGIFLYIYHKNEPNVGKYTIHGWYGKERGWFLVCWKDISGIPMEFDSGKNIFSPGLEVAPLFVRWVPHTFGGFLLKKQAQPPSIPQGGGIAVRGGLRLKGTFSGGGEGNLSRFCPTSLCT